MHAHELIELAAVAAVHGTPLILSREPIPADAIEAYWTASKSRLDRWGRALKDYTRQVTSDTAPISPRDQETVRAVLEEVLTGEVLTRVWSAVLCAYDRSRGTDQMEPVARSVLIGHLEARHRVLTLLVSGPGIDAEQAVKLNRLRRRIERWTDMLVGYLAARHDVTEFAIDPRRAKDFAEDLDIQQKSAGGRYAWPLTLASLRTAFRVGLSPLTPNADLNAAIASSVLSAFPASLFNSTGLLRSTWLLRMSRVTSDTQGMLNQLLRPNEPSSRVETSDFRHRAKRTRRFGG
jgi:predicted nucleic acid-binding protein